MSSIFSRIVAGEIPCYKIHEDDHFLAFLDVFPLVKGHTLVIPKQVAARNLLEVDGATLAQLMAVVQRLSKLLVEELQPDGVQIAQFNGAPAGQTVFHLHLHIIPRFAGDSLGIHASQQADAEQLKALQARLQKRLGQ